LENRKTKFIRKGWNIFVAWKDGSMSWHPLIAGVNYSYPLALAQYAVDNQLEHKPALAWWVRPSTPKHKNFFKSV
jgi:hypothetical protein